MERLPEKMSAVDAAWLRMDSAVQHMVITAAFEFVDPISYEEIEKVVRERVLTNPRFRQRVVGARRHFARPRWVDHRELDLGAHLHRVTMLPPSDDASLARLIGDLASAPLAPDRPLWTLHYVDRRAADGSPRAPVVIFRLHHAVGDGVSLVRFLIGLADRQDAEARTVGMTKPPRPHGPFGLAKVVGQHMAALLRMLFLPGDKRTVLRGKLGPEKRVGWTRPFPLAELRDIARRHEAKLNDVLMAVVAGAIRRYLADHGGLPPVAELRALVPLFIHGHGGEGELGNHFGLVFLPLLVGIADAHERVRASKARADVVKHSADALVAMEILGVMGVGGPAIEKLGIDIFTRKASVMITNVSGPTAPLRMLGKRLADVLVWAPVAGHVSTGISLVTYDHTVRIGILSDAKRLPDPQAFAQACEAEVDELSRGSAAGAVEGAPAGIAQGSPSQ